MWSTITLMVVGGRFREALVEHGFEEGEAFEYHEHGDVGHALVEPEQIQRHWQTVETFLTRQLELEVSDSQPP